MKTPDPEPHPEGTWVRLSFPRNAKNLMRGHVGRVHETSLHWPDARPGRPRPPKQWWAWVTYEDGGRLFSPQEELEVVGKPKES